MAAKAMPASTSSPIPATPDHWYRDPLYYDIIFDQDTPLEADFLEGAVERHGRRRRGSLKVLEPACGSGRLLVELASRGHRVAGFDLEPAMVEFSRRRLASEGLQGRVEHGRMERFEIGSGPFDLAHCLVSTFKYLLTERGARAHLRRVAAHLRPGGIYVLGFHLSDYGGAEVDDERWHGERGGVAVDCRISSSPADPSTRTERVRSELRIRERGRRHELATEWDFRTYDAGQAQTMLRAVPEFSLEACYDFRYDLGEGRQLDDPWEDVILILKKRP